jgi:E3 ubiquitin-protein ligase RNF213
MNRAVLVQRPEPTNQDISLTGVAILGVDLENAPDRALLEVCPLMSKLKRITYAFFREYSKQNGRDFIGMRDYYCLLKFLRPHVLKASGKADLYNAKIPQELLLYSICRNFGGKEFLLRNVISSMLKELARTSWTVSDELIVIPPDQLPSLTSLITDNLQSSSSRHLMLLTKNYSALWLLFENGMIDFKNTKVIIGSEFLEDKSELFIIQQLNEVKLAMALGQSLILVNCNNMYEALYDVLNQRYMLKKVLIYNSIEFLNFKLRN